MTIGDTEKAQIVLARRGQGIFKENVSKFEKRCRIAGVERPAQVISVPGATAATWRSSMARTVFS
ncbi:MAG TPA: hypothetical protein VLV86_12700 [Vicinamibacterales bacterium]|nr:hypothetical protein [Vicinamibacterales bacterium]